MALLLPALARAEFLLPLAGEQVAPEGTGILYRSSVPAERVDFYWNGAIKGDVKARNAGDGLWQANLLSIPNGQVSLRAIARSASGKVLADESVTFRSGAAPLEGGATGDSRWIQDLALSGGAGFRGGLSEGTLAKRAALRFEADSLKRGAASRPLDNDMAAWTKAQWQIRNGLFLAKVQLEGDLRENALEQPANRYAGEAAFGPWLRVRVGDQYLAWDPLLMDGTRTRGASVELAAANVEGLSWFRANLMAGQLRRRNSAWRGWSGSDSFDVAGTWERQMAAVQLGFGTGERWLANLTLERAWDVVDPGNASLRDVLSTAAPAENVGAALDLRLYAWSRRIELYGNAALTAVTENRYTREMADSTLDSMGLEIPGYFSELLPVNSSTRGSQRFLGENWTDWLQANSSMRAGLRFRHRWGRTASWREEVRYVHRGEDHESFARSVREAARDGFEWSQGLGLLGDRIDLSTRWSLYDVPDGNGGTRSENNLSGTLAMLPADGTNLFLSGSQRTLTGDTTGGYTSRGGNMGISRAQGTGAGTLTMRASYGLQLDRTRLPDTSLGVMQNSVNGQIRFRPSGSAWEPRLSWQTTHQDLSHIYENRLLVGLGTRLFARRLDVQFDAGGARQAKPSTSRWSRLEQSASANLSLGESSSLRLSQQVAWLNPRMDVRADLSWETFF